MQNILNSFEYKCLQMSLKRIKARKPNKDIQKRTFPIQPTKVDKKLIQDLGEFLENQVNRNLILTYSVDSATKEVTKQNVKDFVNTDWGDDIRELKIYSKTAVRITMDFLDPELSEYSVYGKNPTWVNGTAKCIGDIFEKHKLKYAPIKLSKLLKFFLVIFLDFILCFPIFQFLSSYAPSNVGVVILPFLFIPVALNSLIDWLFPYFEYAEPLQKSVRKWIWFILVGLGIVPSIIQKLLGL